MLIYFCVQVLNFELRHRWQMSSIVQQKGNVPKILVDCATLDGGEIDEPQPELED